MSSDFDDDDDELLQALITGKVDGQLYRADGEIAILRAQLVQLQNQKQQELLQLKESYEQTKKNNDEQTALLKHAVQRLEDEKKFLNNELRTTSYSKRRKTASSSQGKPLPRDDWDQLDSSVSSLEPHQVSVSLSTPSEAPAPSLQIAPMPHKVIKLQNESSVLIDHLWNYCISGSSRTCLDYLSKVCIDFDLKVEDLKIVKRTAISSGITEFLMIKKNMRLDELVESFCVVLFEVIDKLLLEQKILAVPFLIALIHCAICYRPIAVGKSLIVTLLEKLKRQTDRLSFLVDSNLDEEDLINYHDVPNQVMVIEKFIFIFFVDLIEKLVTFASLHDEPFVRQIWKDETISTDLFVKCLPENTERFKNSSQINLVTNYVEMLISSITPSTFGYNQGRGEVLNDFKIMNSLIKIFLIDISLKDDFMFYGLNRIIGNNADFKKIDSIIPVDDDSLKNYIILIPQPIPMDLLDQNTLSDFEVQSLHEFHLLNLRLKVGQLIEAYVVTKQSVDILKQKEYFKSIIRIIGFEQIYIMRSPRSKYIRLRIQIVSILVKILNYLTQDIREINNLIYPETMYEMFVVLLRIAFGSDSLSIDAYKLLTEIRKMGIRKPVFNAWSESKARELNHVNYQDVDGKVLADIESDFANGFEFPYEIDTVELAREILNIFVTHEEADNLYFNMNPSEVQNFDEMDLVE
ncbi:uncharacterized protein CANTADRAFT_68410 [Suhomyces tanzawaensis NRRL Y-17324]|uniref:DNA damage checkpoint protein LCD1 n=1 Tax=Suhomyces tanzawaensis NRRL Y-17324 TaxID=984487 RepID=A0A1E4SH01_9ASCO|nr:uncharacterized protein CANTADRAFT_68410 [Suhomyces tanzawaensis NRRL Y-17324]ODV78791.1 hypothetical protein CANTADRAFT_68410 [Suhomyces tanzawaensis NRRL Y-17324]